MIGWKTNGGFDDGPEAWLNEAFMPLGKAQIALMDRGFLYGDGVFETLRAEKGRVLYLNDHLGRLVRSLDALRIPCPQLPEGLTWAGLLNELLMRNKLTREIASVKIIVTRGIAGTLGLPAPAGPSTLCVTAQPYAQPAAEMYGKGWRLHIWREGFAPPTAPFKTLNYLPFLMARQAALDAGAHEAVLLDPQGCVTETAAGSLLLHTDGRWWTPRSPWQLPGITLKQTGRLLDTGAEKTMRRSCSPEDLLQAETIWVLNSLMGIMPVAEVDGHCVQKLQIKEAKRLREALWQEK